MFYQLIQKKRDLWFQSSDCTVLYLVDYIDQRGMLRDAQIDAIKTYLFLKIACQGKPLWQLFAEGKFNETDVDAEEINAEARDVMTKNPAALALYQYSRQKDRNGKQIAPELEQFIRHHARKIDYEKVLKDIFYQVTYSDYLFSLPMGAGKTYLMAALIYIDLYFAQNEPHNPIWAHNFLILAPSGLKSSIVPSLRSIQNFDVTWLFPAATAIAAGTVIYFGGPTIIDPILSLIICALVAHAAWSVLKETVPVMLDAVPEGVNYDEVGEAILSIEGVNSVHDLHVWIMSPGHSAICAHVQITSHRAWPIILQHIRTQMKERFNIDHVALQPEWEPQSGRCQTGPCEICKNEDKSEG